MSAGAGATEVRGGQAAANWEIFERQPFGEVERFVTQKLLDVIQRIVRSELENEQWLRKVARVSGRSYKQMRVTSLEFLDTDVFSVSAGNCVSFLKPLLESWNIDLSTFGMKIVLNHTLVSGHLKKLDFVEREFDDPVEDEPGLTEFLQDTALSGNASRDEIAFLRRLAFKAFDHPLYYYRDLQNLRDPFISGCCRVTTKLSSYVQDALFPRRLCWSWERRSLKWIT